MLFRNSCNNSSFSNSQNSSIPVVPLFPCLAKSLLGYQAISQAKSSTFSQNCTLAPVLSRFWRNLFPKGITYIQGLHSEPYSAITKSGYIHNVVESTGLATLGHNPLGVSAQRLYQNSSTSSTRTLRSPNGSYEHELLIHNRKTAEIPWEDFQLFDSDSDSEANSDTLLFTPMLAPLNEVHQSLENHEEKWEQHNSSSNSETDSNDKSFNSQLN